jgi:hypothetical protein
MGFAQYQEMKKQGKFTTGVPVLTLPNGKEYTQSLAQLRYCPL